MLNFDISLIILNILVIITFIFLILIYKQERKQYKEDLKKAIRDVFNEFKKN